MWLGLTEIRFTLKPSPSSRMVNEPQGRVSVVSFKIQVARGEFQGPRGEVLGSRDEKRVSSYWGLKLRAKIDFNVIALFFYGLRPGRFVVVVNHGESLRSVKTFNLK